MTDLLAGLAFFLVIEGLLYASAPGSLKQIMLRMQEIPDDALRMGGVAVIAIGVGLVWLLRALFGSS